MIRKIFIVMVIALIMSQTNAIAQVEAVAILEGSDTTSVFYGIDAFVAACDSAKENETITLSSGTFNMPETLNKSNLTIKGAGMEYDSIAKIEPTVLIGECLFSDANLLSFEGLHIKGIVHPLSIGTTWMKCKMDGFGNASDGEKNFIVQHRIIQCKITNMGICYNSSATFINTIIKDFDLGTNGNVEMYNCTILGGFLNNSVSLLRNCIVSGNISLNGDKEFYNCVHTGELTSIFDNQTNTTNTILTDYSSLYKTYNGTYTDEETFELTDEAKAKYLGADGKEVGIYGGDYPYNPEVYYPHIVEKDISVVTEDGKLKVNITIGVGM